MSEIDESIINQETTETVIKQDVKPDIEFLARKNPHPRDSHITFD